MVRSPGTVRRQGLSLRAKEEVAGYLFVSPAMLGFLVFITYPILLSMYYSLTEFRLITPARWIGLGNYASLVEDPLYWQSLNVTVRYALAALPLGLVLSLSLAILMNQKLPAIAFWRTVYYLPAVISGVAVAVLWSWILNPEFGLLNGLLRVVGIRGPNWLGDTRTALPALVMISLWGVGGGMVIYLSGLQGIPSELYEAAEIDGASAWRRLLAVTLPLLSPVIFFNLVMGLIGVFQFFTEPYVMT
ncbi:MAG: sugar ABC transporter permease, partial [Anaerolineae bacterium]|nr:sugar ABC transporter permease [Anaerolineae bacterium]